MKLQKIVDSFSFKLMSLICCLISFAGIMIKLFFRDIFLERTILYVVLLVLIAYTAISILLKALFNKSYTRKTDFSSFGMWTFIFVLNLIEYICIYTM